MANMGILELRIFHLHLGIPRLFCHIYGHVYKSQKIKIADCTGVKRMALNTTHNVYVRQLKVCAGQRMLSIHKFALYNIIA